MPRLLNENVLLDAIKRGVSNESFALAADVKNGEYVDLQFGDDFGGQVKPENFLVKASVAKKLLGMDEEPPEVVTEVEAVEEPAPVEQTAKPSPEAEPLPKKFRMDVKLDNLRLNKKFTPCAREVLPHILNLPNVKANIRLVVDISIPEGVPTDIKEIVESNWIDLEITGFSFDG